MAQHTKFLTGSRHPVLAFKQVPLKEVLRYPLALGDPAICEGHARQVDRL